MDTLVTKRRTGRESKKRIWLISGLLWLVPTLRLLLPWVKVARILAWLKPSGAPLRAGPEVLQRARRYTDALLRRFPFAPERKCLLRSLVLYYFAAKCGYPVHLHCGVRRVDDGIQGHAWLSLDGKPFLEPGDPNLTYKTTFSFPPLPRA